MKFRIITMDGYSSYREFDSVEDAINEFENNEDVREIKYCYGNGFEKLVWEA